MKPQLVGYLLSTLVDDVSVTSTTSSTSKQAQLTITDLLVESLALYDLKEPGSVI